MSSIFSYGWSKRGCSRDVSSGVLYPIEDERRVCGFEIREATYVGGEVRNHFGDVTMVKPKQIYVISGVCPAYIKTYVSVAMGKELGWGSPALGIDANEYILSGNDYILGSDYGSYHCPCMKDAYIQIPTGHDAILNDDTDGVIMSGTCILVLNVDHDRDAVLRGIHEAREQYKSHQSAVIYGYLEPHGA